MLHNNEDATCADSSLKSSSTNEADCPYVVAPSAAEALKLARQQYGANVTVKQDDDVLDTWFR